MADGSLSQRWFPDDLILVIFQGQVLVKCIYHSANLYTASETEESFINFRYLGNTLVEMPADHPLGALAVFLLKVIKVLKSGAFLVRTASLKRLWIARSAGSLLASHQRWGSQR